MIRGWNAKYNQIVQEFGYQKQKDRQATKMLDSIISRRFSTLKLKKIISHKTVFVIGSGPSLDSAMPILKKYKDTTMICADTALKPLIRNGIKPQIIVTDLDGDLDLIKKQSKNSIIVVHAHGDNISKLEFARNLKNCIGTTQTEKTGKIVNYGGFTDGDRCVFLASKFCASKIFLFGMDFGSKIGTHSCTKKSERKIKQKKLQYAKMLLEWLAPKTRSNLFTLSKPVKGFTKLTYQQLEHNVSS